MKVILLQDVAKLGRKFDIVEVPNGYGTNKLIPKGLAKPATPANVKMVQARASVYEHEASVNEQLFKELVAALDGQTVTVSVEANDEGKMFEALKPDRIGDAIATLTGKPMSAVSIESSEPIKTLGEHQVTLALGTHTAPLTIMVERAA